MPPGFAVGRSGLVVRRSGQHDFLALAADAVDDRDGLGVGGGRARGRRFRRRSVVAIGPLQRALHVGTRVRLLGFPAGAGGALLGRYDRHRLAAERIVHHHRPADKDRKRTGPAPRRSPGERRSGGCGAASAPCAGRAGRSGHPCSRPKPSRIIPGKLAPRVVNCSFTALRAGPGSRRRPPNATGRPEGRPAPFHRLAARAQFDVVFGFGG